MTFLEQILHAFFSFSIRACPSWNNEPRVLCGRDRQGNRPNPGELADVEEPGNEERNAKVPIVDQPWQR